MNPFLLKEYSYCGSQVTLLQPVAPWARSPFFDSPAQEIIYRYIRAARVTNVAGIKYTTGYSREISRSIRGLIARGWIQVVGRYGYDMVVAPVPRIGLDVAPLLCGGESLFGRGREPYGNSDIKLTNGIFVSEHPFRVMRTVLWILHVFRQHHIPCVPYFETTLWKWLRWAAPGVEDGKPVYYRTTIPDVWIVFPGMGAFRLEVQLTRANYRKLETVVDDISHDDQILFVVPSSAMVKSVSRVQGRRTFGVVEFNNGEQFVEWANEFLARIRNKPGGPSPLVTNYGSLYFRSLMLKNAGVFAQPKPVLPPQRSTMG